MRASDPAHAKSSCNSTLADGRIVVAVIVMCSRSAIKLAASTAVPVKFEQNLTDRDAQHTANRGKPLGQGHCTGSQEQLACCMGSTQGWTLRSAATLTMTMIMLADT